MDRKYQVFVSSTYNDLKEERSAVIKCLLDNDCIPVGMEQFHGVPISQWDYITKMLDSSDYCILILAGKYGSIEERSGVGYTEKEFDYAVANNIPVIRLLHKDINSLRANQIEVDSNKRKKLLSFINKAKHETLADFYESIDDLRNKVSIAIHKAIKYCPRPGWVRYDQLQKEIATNADLQKRIEELERQVLAGSEGKFTQEDVADIFRDDDINLSEEKVRQIVSDEIDVHTATDEEFNAMLKEVGF